MPREFVEWGFAPVAMGKRTDFEMLVSVMLAATREGADQVPHAIEALALGQW